MPRTSLDQTVLDREEVPALTPAGERLLDVASRLFYSHGIRAVGVDRVAAEAGTTKKTLYDIFGSKDLLVALYLHRRGVRWRSHLTERLAAREPGTDRLLGVYDVIAEWHADQDRGCAFVNAYAEIGTADHPALPVIRADKAYMRELFRRLAVEAGRADAERTGDTLHLLYEGALVLSTAGARPDAISEARRAAQDLLARN
ncbi:TetR/AcrR family transcriptional regulator [Georgenia alba]|uniref:TetR/AcrR family transcriptional regulator n=1 Tax=Georgenia alba TaxID=2233858 RepID=A0ABW2QHI7_9MICO